MKMSIGTKGGLGSSANNRKLGKGDERGFDI
jgi:hypothetical protein